MKTNQMVCHLKKHLFVTHRNIIMHIILFIYLFLFINSNTETKSNIYTVVNMKRNICPMKLNYIMTKCKNIISQYYLLQ